MLCYQAFVPFCYLCCWSWQCLQCILYGIVHSRITLGMSLLFPVLVAYFHRIVFHNSKPKTCSHFHCVHKIRFNHKGWNVRTEFFLYYTSCYLINVNLFILCRLQCSSDQWISVFVHFCTLTDNHCP